MEIQHRWTEETIFKSDKRTMRETVEEAIKKGADLYLADLRWADLHGADLHGADLHDAGLIEKNENDFKIIEEE